MRRLASSHSHWGIQNPGLGARSNVAGPRKRIAWSGGGELGKTEDATLLKGGFWSQLGRRRSPSLVHSGAAVGHLPASPDT